MHMQTHTQPHTATKKSKKQSLGFFFRTQRGSTKPNFDKHDDTMRCQMLLANLVNNVAADADTDASAKCRWRWR